MSGTRSKGAYGETEALAYLTNAGYAKLCSNYKRGGGEIDLIMRDGDNIVFIEVKARGTGRAGHPAEAVTPAKIRRIVKTALYYLKENKLLDYRARFDVVEIEAGRVRHLKAAFDATGVF